MRLLEIEVVFSVFHRRLLLALQENYFNVCEIFFLAIVTFHRNLFFVRRVTKIKSSQKFYGRNIQVHPYLKCIFSESFSPSFCSFGDSFHLDYITLQTNVFITSDEMHVVSATHLQIRNHTSDEHVHP